MSVGVSVGDAYITVHADTKRFQNSIGRLSKVIGNLTSATKALDRTTDRFEKTADRTRKTTEAMANATRRKTRSTKELNDVLTGLDQNMRIFNDRWDRFGRRIGGTSRQLVVVRNQVDKFNTRFWAASRTLDIMHRRTRFLRSGLRGLTAPFALLGRSVSNSFRRMDRTVRLVLQLIAVAAPQIAALGSALSSTLVAIGSSAFYALAGLAPLLGLLGPLAFGLAFAVGGLSDLEKTAPKAFEAVENMKRVFSEVDVPAFMRAWEEPLANFLNTFADSMEFDELAQNLGEAFGEITDAFTELLESPSWTQFVEAMEGPLGDAFSTFGQALAPLVGTLMDFMTAAAPFTQLLADNFLAWAEGMQEAFGASVDSGEFTAFMEDAMDALDTVLGLFGALKDVLGTLFEAGVGPGNTFLDLITDLLNEFDEWMNSIEGQNALQEWFENGATIMGALFDLLGVVGPAIADLVTPQVVDQLVGLLDGLAVFLVLLTDILAVVAKAGIIDLIVHFLTAIGTAVTPLLPLLGDLLEIVARVITEAFDILAPILATVFELLSLYLAPAIEILSPLIDEWFKAMEPLIPVIEDIIADVIEWAQAFAEDLQPQTDKLLDALVNSLIPALADFAEEVLPLIGLMIDLALEFVENYTAGEELVAMLVWLIEETANAIDKYTAFVGWLKDAYNWFIDLNDAVLDLVNSISKLDFSGVTGALGDLPGASLTPFFASGTIATSPTVGVFGEAGAEALVPLNRPLDQVDPSVRALSAFAQGLHPGGGGGVTIAPGAISIVTPVQDPAIVAEMVIDRIAARL